MRSQNPFIEVARTRFVRVATTVTRNDRRTVALCCAAVAAACLSSGIAAVVQGWRPSWDTAFVQLRVLDVGTRRTPLIGMPSTVSQTLAESAHHPGPLHAWLLAIPNLATRSLAGGLALAQAVLNAALAGLSVGAVFLARGRRAGVVATGLWLLALLAMGNEMLHDPWNPHAATIALLVAALCATSACLDDRAVPHPLILVTLVGSASLAAQAHLAALIPAVMMVAVGLAALARRVATHETASRWTVARRPTLTVIGTFLMCWVGPLLDQAIHRPGNLRTLIGGGDSLGDSFGIVGGFDRLAAAAIPPGLFRSGLPSVAAGGARWTDRLVLVLLIAAVAAVTARCRTARHTAGHWCGVVALVLTAATWVSQVITPITFGSVFGRHMWELMWPATLGLWFALAIGLTQVLPISQQRDAADSRSPFTPFAQPARFSVVAVAVLAAASLVRPAASDISQQRDGRWFEAIARASDRMPDDLSAVTIITNGIAIESELVAGVAADLQRRGTFVRFSGQISEGLVHPRRTTPQPIGDTLLFTTADDQQVSDLEPIVVIDPPPAVPSAVAIAVYLLPAAPAQETP
jgi:hypothetical protein